jgi:2-oxoglutarate dehydrogenase E1 component
LSNQSTKPDLSEVIAENFGANASYVEGLLGRFRNNPELVDESWRVYFIELLGQAPAVAEPSGNGRGSAATAAASEPATTQTPATSAAPATPERQATAAVAPQMSGEATPIRGAALKIVENMEASLAVPTATSQRRIPVKLLDENRRIINKNLARPIAAKLRTPT